MATSHLGIALACCALWPVMAAAQTGSTLNCGAASGVTQAMICSDPSLGESDGRIAERVETAVELLEEQGEEGEEAIAKLRETQQAFTTARDACNRSTDTRDCVARAYALREAELIATYDLEEPASSVTYTCSDAGGESISISFFDLETPTVRIENGDDMAAGTSVPTPDARYASKYALNTGQELWVRSDVARFTGADGRTQTCTKTDS